MIDTRIPCQVPVTDVMPLCRIYNYASGATLLSKDHRGTETFAIEMYNDLESGVNLVKQVEKIGNVMIKFMQQHPDGVNVICYSQGKEF